MFAPFSHAFDIHLHLPFTYALRTFACQLFVVESLWARSWCLTTRPTTVVWTSWSPARASPLSPSGTVSVCWCLLQILCACFVCAVGVPCIVDWRSHKLSYTECMCNHVGNVSAYYFVMWCVFVYCFRSTDYQQRHVSWTPVFVGDENLRAGNHYYSNPKVKLNTPACWQSIVDQAQAEQYPPTLAPTMAATTEATNISYDKT